MSDTKPYFFAKGFHEHSKHANNCRNSDLLLIDKNQFNLTT